MMNRTEHADRARAAKVAALTATLVQAGATAANARHLTVAAWTLAADVAGVGRPSNDTSAAVIRALELRDQQPADPFADLEGWAA